MRKNRESIQASQLKEEIENCWKEQEKRTKEKKKTIMGFTIALLVGSVDGHDSVAHVRQ